MTTLHVSVAGDDTASGSSTEPLRTINRAAELAYPGDTVLVHEGEYREWVRPRRGGLDEARRITYEAAPGERVVVKGSEPVTDWVRVSGSTWRAEVHNSLFGEFNPFAIEVDGDWVIYDEGTPRKHLGDVYLNGRSFYEAASVEEVAQGAKRDTVEDLLTGVVVPTEDPEQTRYRWYAEVGGETTQIWANFQGVDPREELVEINVRPAVFFPTAHHLNFITVRGFELAQAATPWAPPTAEQIGLIGPNWAHGWVIEDNVIRDAKCSAVSLGKERSSGHNHFTERGDRPGYQYQIEAVFNAREIGWERGRVGSHVVRRNTIFNCGQNAIVGHLGCAFSTIEENHIHNIGTKREFFGHEIAGIKFHAAIDSVISGNRIHSCTLGVWLDWQTQGTRVSRNVLYKNSRDLFVEVSHGPYIVDHNVFGSAASLENQSQGGAYVSNLFLGKVLLAAEMERATPYHFPHSTKVAGFATIAGGDDRFIGNIFLAVQEEESYGRRSYLASIANIGYGTSGYDPHPPTFEEYLDRVAARPPETHRRYIGVHQPVYLSHNVYGPGASAYSREVRPTDLAEPLTASIVEDGDAVYLELDVPEDFGTVVVPTVSSGDLPPVRFADSSFENPDGSSVVLDRDLLGQDRPERGAAGPISTLGPGRSRIRIG